MNPNMTYSRESCAHLTERFEGCKLVAYQDIKGVWTIGYGHTGQDVVPGLTITQQQAEDLLMRDIQSAARFVNTYVHVTLNQNEFDALTDFTFNVGAGNFSSSTLLKDLNAGDYKAAAAEFPKWDKASGQVVQGLLNRRLAEQELFNS